MDELDELCRRIGHFQKARRQCLKGNGLKAFKDKKYPGQTNIDVYCRLKEQLIQLQETASINHKIRRQLQSNHLPHKWRQAIRQTLESAKPTGLHQDQRQTIQKLLQSQNIHPSSIMLEWHDWQTS